MTIFGRNRFISTEPSPCFSMSALSAASDPVVVTGSANFSPASQSANDENMLVIRGSERVADIYFGEFMRIFDHLYSRYIVAKLEADGRGDPDAGYLKDKADDWVPGDFRPGRKDLRRRYFMGRD